MVRTQVYLTEEQAQGLKRLAASTGQRQSELIRAALGRLLADKQERHWLKTLEPMFGMWADRDDLDEQYTNLRREADERLDRFYSATNGK